MPSWTSPKHETAIIGLAIAGLVLGRVGNPALGQDPAAPNVTAGCGPIARSILHDNFAR